MTYQFMSKTTLALRNPSGGQHVVGRSCEVDGTNKRATTNTVKINEAMTKQRTQTFVCFLLCHNCKYEGTFIQWSYIQGHTPGALRIHPTFCCAKRPFYVTESPLTFYVSDNFPGFDAVSDKCTNLTAIISDLLLY